MPTITLKHKVSARIGREGSPLEGLRFASRRCLREENKELAGSQLEISEQQQLVLQHRDMAHRMAHALLRRWNVSMEADEAGSLADLALCKAAQHFSPAGGASFSTYSFHYLRGVLIRAISRGAAGNWLVLSDDGNIEMRAGLEDSPEEPLEGGIGTPPPSPEKVLYLKELQRMYSDAVLKMSSLEREVVESVQFGEVEVAEIARRHGYSRGHFSKVLNGARRSRLAELREELKEAA